jgi:hypothetical protein
MSVLVVFVSARLVTGVRAPHDTKLLKESENSRGQKKTPVLPSHVNPMHLRVLQRENRFN